MAASAASDRKTIRLTAENVRTAPDPAIIGGSTNKHSSDQLNPVIRTPASKTAALKAKVPAKWTAYLIKYRPPPARILIEETVVDVMTPGSRTAGSVSSVLTPDLRARHPDCGITC